MNIGNIVKTVVYEPIELADENCLTMPDGECVSEKPCMHTEKEATPQEESIVPAS